MDANLTSRTVNALNSWPLFCYFWMSFEEYIFPNGGSALSSECCHEVNFLYNILLHPQVLNIYFFSHAAAGCFESSKYKVFRTYSKTFFFLPEIGPQTVFVVVRSLECRNIVSFFSFLSLEGLPEVPTIEFYPADVYMQSKLDIPFHFRNVLSSSRLIY